MNLINLLRCARSVAVLAAIAWSQSARLYSQTLFAPGGTGANGVGTSTTSNVGVGTSSPGTRLEVNGVLSAGKSYLNVITVGPLSSAPAYVYINTRIPFNDSPAPQLQITGYNYAAGNRAVKLTLGWYVYQNAFHWSQYKCDLGYHNPSRIRLGTYNDAGTTRVRIEIANDGTYWSSYFVSATDHNGVAANYNGWTYALGEFPADTGQATVVPQHGGLVYTAAGFVGIGTSNPTSRLTVKGDLQIGNSDDPRGYSLAQNYLSLGETESGATTILGNNIKVVNDTDNTLHVSVSSADGSNWLGVGYLHGFTFNHIGPSPVGTQVNEHTGELMRIATNGNVGIGTTNPTQKLSVNGTIKAKEVIVETTGWSDYVFADNYRLAPLSEVEAHIKAEKRLPGIPSEQQVVEQGVSIVQMQAALLAKIEELTLHMIRLERENAELKRQIAEIVHPTR